MTTVTFGFWNGGSVQPIESTGDGTHTLSNFYLGNNWGGVASWVANPVTNTYELSVNDVFSSNAGVARFYATFQGVTTPFPELTIPTVFESNSIQPGATFIDQVFICPATSPLFCDNSVVGDGTLIGQQSWTTTGNTFPTLSAIAPGSPYDITLMIQIASNISQNITPIGDFASAIIVTPSTMVPVPSPIVGEGIAAILVVAVMIRWRKAWLRKWCHCDRT